MCFSLISEKLTNKALDIQSVFHLLSLWWTLKLIRFSFSSGKATCDGRWGAVEADWMEWWWMYCGGMIDLKKKVRKQVRKSELSVSYWWLLQRVSSHRIITNQDKTDDADGSLSRLTRTFGVKYSDYMAENSSPLPLKMEFFSEEQHVCHITIKCKPTVMSPIGVWTAILKPQVWHYNICY